MNGSTIAALFATALAASVALPLAIPDSRWPTIARDYLAERGFAETGAGNLVSAVYLGYRAFDTLGETLVLLSALAAAVALVHTERRSDSGAGGTESASAPGFRRTEIIDLTAGKLAPVVLLFGFYVMLYGHLSPGGGFQGGAVIASGIVFIALGRREGGLGRIDPRRRYFSHDSLALAEAFAFAAIMALVVSGATAGSLFLANPLEGSDAVQVAFIIAFNAAIGLKVGSGFALVCLAMMGDGR